MRTCCPVCGSIKYKKNGFTYYGKQNYKCKICTRQFVKDFTKKVISDDDKEKIKKLLLERLSLLGICRVMGITLKWLLELMGKLYDNLPDDLNAQHVETKEDVVLCKLEAEADEMWSFVGNKENKQWIWLAIDSKTRQVIAFYVGSRGDEGAENLWERIPTVYKENATFYTDHWDAYKNVIPAAQHQSVDKDSGKTSGIERVNLTLRQRISRLVRKTLSFSKKQENHVGAIKYFLCDYNLALHV